MRTRTIDHNGPSFALARRGAAALLAATMATTAGCMSGPYDGQMTGGAFGTSLLFTGYYDSPNIDIKIQVLDTPDTNPTWTTVKTVTTSSTPKYYPSTDTSNPYYEWEWTGVPAANDATGKERWPTGGLMRVRAVAKDPNGHGSNYVLEIADEDQNACFGAHQSDNWKGLVVDCGKDPIYGAAIADVDETPADVFTGHPASAIPDFLTRKKYGLPSGVTQELETLNYYATQHLPATLGDFKSKFGFTDGSGNPVSAKYYNFGDLGIGRHMNCAVKNGTTACFVSNFAPLSGGVPQFGHENESLDLVTTAGSTPFATVAMIFTPPVTDPDSVKFVVYDKNGNWQFDAQLDSRGDNTEIPGNCLSCHGGSSSYDTTNHSVRAGAHFLPFDVFNSLHFSGDSGFTYGDQAEKMRKLNVMVMNAGATPAIKEFITGLYQNTPTVANTDADPDWAPTKWKDTPAHQKLYSSVVAPYCRTCHVSNAVPSTNKTTALDFSAFDGFSGFAGSINADVCAKGGHVMPHAEQTLKNFWDSPARAHLTGTLGLYGSCNPL